MASAHQETHTDAGNEAATRLSPRRSSVSRVWCDRRRGAVRRPTPRSTPGNYTMKVRIAIIATCAGSLLLTAAPGYASERLTFLRGPVAQGMPKSRAPNASAKASRGLIVQAGSVVSQKTRKRGSLINNNLHPANRSLVYEKTFHGGDASVRTIHPGDGSTTR